MKTFALLVAAGLALAGCSGGAGEEAAAPSATPFVSTVSVTGDLTAVTSRSAAAYWGNLSRDLESAIAAEFLGSTSSDGLQVAVDIDEISLANLVQGGTDARLTGRVALTDPNTGAASGVYTVSASATQAMEIMGVDPAARVQVIPASSDEFYRAVVAAFARGVADVVRTGGTLRTG